MKKITNDRFQETYYEETLENGLKVVLWEKPNFKKSFFMMATPLGALDLIQIDEKGNKYEFPSGIAHFLEHKMFEKQNRDVMEEFTSMGANCNAFTSYSETAYYFSTSENPIQPLHLLMDFVQELDISESSVEKEKGIIIQELEMYMQMSESRMLNETMAALYENHPLKFDIGGSRESVNAITKNDLDQCYMLNYHPSRMLLIGVTGHDIQTIMNEIRKNQNSKSFLSTKKIKRISIDEREDVYKAHNNVYMDVGVPKVCVAFKLKGIKNPSERNKMEWKYKLLLDMYFSSMNPSLQKWIDDGIINNSFSFEIDFGDDYGMILFYSETNERDKFVHTILHTLSSIQSIEEAALNQLKQRYFGVSISALGSMKQIAITYMRNYFAKQDFFESIEDLENISTNELLDALSLVNLDNYSCVTIEKNKE